MYGRTPTKDPPLAWLDVDTAFAGQLLDHAEKNRPIASRHVAQLRNDMVNDLWRPEACDPIKINEKGAMYEGNHRMRALLGSGRIIRFLFAFAIPPECCRFEMDKKPVKAGGAAHAHGRKYAANCAGAVGWYLRLKHMAGSGKPMWNPTSNYQLTQRQTYDLVMDDDRFEAVSFDAMAVGRAINYSGPMVTALWVLLSEISEDNAVLFFAEIKDGVGLKKTDATYVLREHFRRKFEELTRLRLRARTQAQQVSLAAITLKAWMFWTKGDKIKQLKYLDTEPFPNPGLPPMTAEELKLPPRN